MLRYLFRGLLIFAVSSSSVAVFGQYHDGVLRLSEGKPFTSLGRENIEYLRTRATYYDLFDILEGSNPTLNDLKTQLNRMRRLYAMERARGNPDEPSETRTLATPDEVNALWVEKILPAFDVLGSLQKREAYLAALRLQRRAGGAPEAAVEPEVINPNVDPSKVEKFVNTFLRQPNLLKYLEQNFRNNDGAWAADPNFVEALKQVALMRAQAAVGVKIPEDPFWRRLLRGTQWGDVFNHFFFIGARDLRSRLAYLTPDRQTQFAVHLLLLNTLSSTNEEREYFEALALTLNRYGDLQPNPKLKALYDLHVNAANLMALFDDRSGAPSIKSLAANGDMIRNIGENAIRLSTRLNPMRSIAVSEMMIRLALEMSVAWNKVAPKEFLKANHAALLDVLALDTRAWTHTVRPELIEISKDSSQPRAMRKNAARLVKVLDKEANRTQKRLTAQLKQRERIAQGLPPLTKWERFKEMCRFLFD